MPGSNTLEIASGTVFTYGGNVTVGSLDINGTMSGSGESAPAGWYSTGGTWNYRKAITIDYTKVASSTGESYANFPILINLASDANLAAYASSTGELIAWVKVPSLSTTTDTTLYMYYGNAAAGKTIQFQASGDGGGTPRGGGNAGGGGAIGTVTLVQNRAGDNGFGSNPYNHAFLSPNTAGNTIVVLIQWLGGALGEISSVADTQGNAYTVIPASRQRTNPTANYSHLTTQIAYAINIKAGANTVSVAWNPGSPYQFVSIYELSPSTLDAVSVGTGTSNTPSAGTVSSVVNGEYALAVTLLDNGSGSQMLSAGNGWTLDQAYSGGSSALATQYRTVSAIGQITGNFNSSVTGQWVTSMVLFKPHSNSTPAIENGNGGGTPTGGGTGSGGGGGAAP